MVGGVDCVGGDFSRDTFTLAGTIENHYKYAVGESSPAVRLAVACCTAVS